MQYFILCPALERDSIFNSQSVLSNYSKHYDIIGLVIGVKLSRKPVVVLTGDLEPCTEDVLKPLANYFSTLTPDAFSYLVEGAIIVETLVQ
jgi:hypothetical protein